MLFRDWVTEWQQTRVVKPSTAAADRARLPHLIRAFGDLPLASISPLLVGQWVADLTAQGYASKTVRHLHALLSGVLHYAVREGLLGATPCADPDLPELVAREPVFLDEVELRALLAAHDDYWRPFPVTLGGTGLRWAEAVGLRVRYVDLGRAELRVAWTWTSTYGWQTPKSKTSKRTIGLPPAVVAALEPLVVGRDGGEHVFTMPSGVPVHHGYRDRVWRAALVAAGLTGRAPTPHDLRHTHASHLIADGVPLTAIQRRLGHKSIAITSDVYGHLLPRVDEVLLASAQRSLVGAPDYVPDDFV
jgi:integrase